MHIATPCHQDWSAMTPLGAGRHCAACAATVVDLTALAPAASLAALGAVERRLQAGEHLCVRAHAHPDGRLRATRGRRRLLTNGIAAVLAVTMAGTLIGCEDGTPSDPASGTTTCAPIDGGGGRPRALTGEPTVAQAMMGAPAPQPEARMGDVAEPPPRPDPQPQPDPQPEPSPHPPGAGPIAPGPGADGATASPVDRPSPGDAVQPTPRVAPPLMGKVAAPPALPDLSRMGLVEQCER